MQGKMKTTRLYVVGWKGQAPVSSLPFLYVVPACLRAYTHRQAKSGIYTFCHYEEWNDVVISFKNLLIKFQLPGCPILHFIFFLCLVSIFFSHHSLLITVRPFLRTRESIPLSLRSVATRQSLLATLKIFPQKSRILKTNTEYIIDCCM